MSSILIAVSVFLFTFLMQLVIVRILRRIDIHVFFSFAIYAIGLIIVVVMNSFLLTMALEYKSLLVYVFLAIIIINISTWPLSGQTSPSALIMIILQREKEITLERLQKKFDENQLILRRIDDFVDLDLVNKRNNRYIISRKGLLLNLFISKCSALMGLKMQG